jgi:hypothetical protein
MRFLACLSGPLIVVSILYACASEVADNQPLRAVPELISQQYCSGDAEVFAVNLRLRMKYTKRTEKALILDKEIGNAWYGISVARNVEDLAAGNYEYHPNIDWFFTDKDRLPKKPSSTSPGPDFAILAPGQTLESEIDTAVVVQ